MQSYKVGRRLAVAREDLRLSQKEMAERLSVKQQTYSRYERNEIGLPIQEIARFADVLDIPIQEFIPETTSIHNHNKHSQGVVIANDVSMNYNFFSGESSEEMKILKEQIALLQKQNEMLRQQLMGNTDTSSNSKEV